MHGGEPLLDDTSIRDFNGGIGCHVASSVEEALLLPKDMAEIKNAKKNELILNNKRYLAMVLRKPLSFLSMIIFLGYIRLIDYNAILLFSGYPKHI